MCMPVVRLVLTLGFLLPVYDGLNNVCIPYHG